MDTVTVPPFYELEDRILPWSQVKIICGLSRTTVWRMSKTGDFPACVQVSQNRVGWWQSELLAWKRARTPRRLPEPRVVLAALKPLEPTQVSQTVEEQLDTSASVVATGQDPTAKTRRKRKPVVPENQTTFDFGG